MYCKQCGKQIDNNSIFCNSCGTKQSDNNPEDFSTETKQIDVYLKIKKPNKNKFDSTKTKYDKSYKKEKDATPFGILFILISIVLLFVYRNEDIPISGEYIVLSGILFIFRILLTIWIVRIAKRQNRSSLGWGFFGFFFPLVILIIIGQLRKINNPTLTDLKGNANLRNKNVPIVYESQIKAPYTEKNELDSLRRTLKHDELIIMQKEDEIYSVISISDWEVAKEKGASQLFIEVDK